MEQVSFLDDLYQRYKVDKPIRTIELFAGYGATTLALDHLGVKYEPYRIVEWNAYSTLAYDYLHNDTRKDYSKEFDLETIILNLEKLGLSFDWNKPATPKQIRNRKESFLRDVYNAIMNTNNCVDISRVKGKDLAMRERERWCVIMTYSFPCQDISLAGKQKGLERDSNTRSSLLYQVERILFELEKINQLPDILILENVKELLSEKHIHNFNLWCNTLEKIGYETYTSVLNSADYGIPQHRERVFCVSLLNSSDKYYQFPSPFKLEKCVDDLLEKVVDERYYLTNKQIEAFEYWNAYEKPLETLKRERESGIMGTLTTHAGKNSGGIKLVGNYTPKKHNASRVIDGDGIAPTVKENHGTITGIKLKNEN